MFTEWFFDMAEVIAWPLTFFHKKMRFKHGDDSVSAEQRIVRRVTGFLWGIVTTGIYTSWFWFLPRGKYGDWRLEVSIGLALFIALIMCIGTEDV